MYDIEQTMTEAAEAAVRQPHGAHRNSVRVYHSAAMFTVFSVVLQGGIREMQGGGMTMDLQAVNAAVKAATEVSRVPSILS